MNELPFNLNLNTVNILKQQKDKHIKSNARLL